MQLIERKNLTLPPAQHMNHLNPLLPLCFSSTNVITSLVATVAKEACGAQHQHHHQRPVGPCRAHLHVTASQNMSPPSDTRLTLLFQHQWTLRFSPWQTELVWLIKTKQGISLLGCIITSMDTLCTYAHLHTCVHTHASHCDRDLRPWGWQSSP